MVVDVDEARREHQALGVDHVVGRGGLEVADRSDPVVSDANICFAQRRAGAVCDLCVDDDGAGKRD